MTPKLVHNEQVKLLAYTLNSIGLTAIGTGVVAPVASLLYGALPGPVPTDRMLALALVFLATGFILLVAARGSLRGMRE